MYSIISTEKYIDQIKKIVSEDIIFEKIGTFENSEINSIFQEASRVLSTILVLDINIGNENTLVQAVKSFRIVRPHTRIILIAPGRTPGDTTISKLVSIGVYDIISPYISDDEQDVEISSYLADAINKKPATYSDAARWDVGIPLNNDPGVQGDKPKVIEKIIEMPVVKVETIEKETIIEAPPKTQRQEIITVAGIGSVGKSDMVTQLAISLAKKSKAKILVIDLNTEFPTLDQYFGIPKEPQLVDYLIGSDKNTCLNYMVDNIDKGRFDSNVFDELVIKHKKYDNLHILTGNYSLYICQNVLKDSYYKTILDKAKALYDFIFIDTSSNLFLDSTQFAVTNATSVLFVAEGNYVNLRKSLIVLELYTKTWDVRKDKIQIIINKYSQHSLDQEVIEEILKGYKICQYIKHDTRHEYYMNKNIPMMVKPLKKDLDQYLKILEAFHFVKKRSFFEKLFKTKAQKLEDNEIRKIESQGISG